MRAESLPWLTCEIRELMGKRDFQHKRAQKQKTTEEWIKYKELRNKTTSLIGNAKQDYYSNLIEENKKDPSKLRKTLKSVIATKKMSTFESLETDSGVIQDPKKISQTFTKYFSTAIVKLRQCMTSVLSASRTPANRSTNNSKLSQVSESFVAKELKKLKSDKSTGLHNIPARLLKDGADALATPLALLMNRSINERSIPASWKHAIVTPVFKSGSKSDTPNYRPISVLPVFAKILEKAVHEMMYNFLLQHKLLFSYQSGFRPLHSTATSLIDITNTILQNIDKGKLTGLAFLDLSKAFDTLDHDLLLTKLAGFGLSKSSVNWFNAYLTNRTQSVIINGIQTDAEPILYGVPQGSVLGPLLFIMYINDLPSVTKCCKVHLYADDTLLFFETIFVQASEAALSQDLDHVVGWLNQNYLMLNHSKTKVMLMGTHQKLSSVQSFTVSVNDKDLERVYKFKYLGVILDPCLT